MPLPVIATRRKELREALAALRSRGSVGFVPTLGALHEGHASLLRASKARHPVSVLSIFVNPKQFGPTEDFARYPRTLQGDIALAQACGVDVIYAPTVEEMYPLGFKSQVRVEGMDNVLCGAFRPGHFDGVCTVVLLLLNLVGANEAFFGLKDFQQVAILKRLCADLAHPTTLVALPTVREEAGLAMSSRNRYLSPEERAVALAIPRALATAAKAWIEGQRNITELASAAGAVLAAAGLDPQYLEARTMATLSPVEGEWAEPCALAVALRVGATRLIDNVVFPGGQADPDAALATAALEDLVRLAFGGAS